VRLEPHRSLAQVTVASLSASVAKSMVYILAEAAPSVLAPPPLRPFFFNGMLSRKRRLQLQLQPMHQTTHAPNFVYSTRTCDSPTLSMPGLQLPFRQPRKTSRTSTTLKAKQAPARCTHARAERHRIDANIHMQQGTGSSRLALVCRKKGAAEQTENGTDNGARSERNDVRGSGECRGRRADTNPTALCGHPLFAQNAFLFPACSCTMREPAQNSPEDTLG